MSMNKIIRLYLYFKNSNIRTTGTVYDYGVHSAFRIILDPNVNDNVLSTISIDGFKVTPPPPFIFAKS